MILVDSSVWIDYFRGNSTPESERLHALLGQEPLAVGDLIMAEVLQGVGTDRDFETALRLLEKLDLVVIGGHDLAVIAARHYRTLRELGVTVRKTTHTLIATRCIIDGMPLLYSDRDIDPFVERLGLVSGMGAG